MKRTCESKDLKKQIPVQETFRIAAILAVVGGFLDAYTYLLRGGVFANAQTGNIVLLGIHLADGNVARAGYYIIPILAFAFGVFLTEVFKKYFSTKEFHEYEHYIIIIEILLLTVIGSLPPEIPDMAVNVSVSFICSLQANSFRKMKELPFVTTMCTGNLRSGTEKLFQYVYSKERKAGIEAAHYFGIIGLFVAGAALGAILAGPMGEKSIWVCSGLLITVFIMMRKN